VNEHKRVEYLLFHILQTQDVLEQCISKEPKHARVIRFGTLKQLFVETENIARKVGLHINQGKTKYIIVERKKSSKQNKIGQLTIQNYTFQRAENFKHLSVILNEEDNNHLIDFPERVKNSNEMYFMFIYFCTILCNNLLINFCSPFYFHLYCIMFIVQC